MTTFEITTIDQAPMQIMSMDLNDGKAAAEVEEVRELVAEPKVWSLQTCARHHYNDFRSALDNFVMRAHRGEADRLKEEALLQRASAEDNRNHQPSVGFLGFGEKDSAADSGTAADIDYEPWPKAPPKAPPAESQHHSITASTPRKTSSIFDFGGSPSAEVMSSKELTTTLSEFRSTLEKIEARLGPEKIEPHDWGASTMQTLADSVGAGINSGGGSMGGGMGGGYGGGYGDGMSGMNGGMGSGMDGSTSGGMLGESTRNRSRSRSGTDLGAPNNMATLQHWQASSARSGAAAGGGATQEVLMKVGDLVFGDLISLQVSGRA